MAGMITSHAYGTKQITLIRNDVQIMVEPVIEDIQPEQKYNTSGLPVELYIREITADGHIIIDFN